MAMTGRTVDHGLRILTAAALLLAVMSSPIRPTRASHAPPPPNYLHRNFAIPNDGHSGLFAMSARPSLREGGALASEIEDERDAEIEDELTVRSAPAPGSFDRLRPLCPKAPCALMDVALPLAARPLRC